MSKGLTIIELEKQERFSEAGYGKLFAYQSSRFNAMIDSRSKAKFLRRINPSTYKETQEELLYSGPTVFFDKDISFIDMMIMKADIRSAYPSYLINHEIKKPGMFRIKYKGNVPLTNYITLYTIRFRCELTNLFAKWFLNSSAIHKQKIQSDGQFVWGDVSIFSSISMNLMKYVTLFLGDKAIIKQSIVFFGTELIKAEKQQIRKLYSLKESGFKEAKRELNESTGWLSLIDRPTYYHMIQYIKFFLLETVYNYNLEDDLIGIQTDCIFYRINDNTSKAKNQIQLDKLTLSNERSNMGTYKFEEAEGKELVTRTARIILNEKEKRLQTENTEANPAFIKSD